jgi:hypothetical protein
MFALVNVQSDLSQYAQALGAGKVKLPVKSHENPDAESNTVVSICVFCLINMSWFHLCDRGLTPFRQYAVVSL